MRAVIDETSMCLDGLDPSMLDEEFLHLAEVIQALRQGGDTVGIISGWGASLCLNQEDVATVLTSPRHLSRDVRNLIIGILSKCPAWDDEKTVAVDDEILVDGHPHRSFGVAYAALLVSQEIGMAVVTTRHGRRSGECRVDRQDGPVVSVHFLHSVKHIASFYRSLFDLEEVPESKFFEVAVRAFPNLAFAEGLTFRKFQGSYLGLREAVVEHLAALNDRFSDAFVAEAGNSARVSARIGISVSIEGNTRNSPRLMRHRDVEFEGKIFRCEWHSKIEPHRNRIHFYPSSSETGERVLIGMFVDHLPT